MLGFVYDSVWPWLTLTTRLLEHVSVYPAVHVPVGGRGGGAVALGLVARVRSTRVRRVDGLELKIAKQQSVAMRRVFPPLSSFRLNYLPSEILRVAHTHTKEEGWHKKVEKSATMVVVRVCFFLLSCVSC